MWDSRDLKYVEYRHRDLIREAQQARLAREVQSTRRRAPAVNLAFHHQPLAELGRCLAALGEQLEMRYQ